MQEKTRGTTPEVGEWLTLGEASRLLGIHPATLRHWADQGAIKFFRTPGGHRRFALRDLQTFLTSPQLATAPEEYLQVALRHTRELLTSPQVAGEHWYMSFSEADKEKRRQSGRRLLGLLMQYLSNGEEDRQKALQEAQKAAREYGEDAARRGLTSRETAKAFIFFRDFLVETPLQTFEEGGWERGKRTYIQINRFMNELFLAMIDAYEKARS